MKTLIQSVNIEQLQWGSDNWQQETGDHHTIQWKWQLFPEWEELRTIKVFCTTKHRTDVYSKFCKDHYYGKFRLHCLEYLRGLLNINGS